MEHIPGTRWGGGVEEVIMEAGGREEKKKKKISHFNKDHVNVL